jgi:UDP-glucose:(heptosyl)LPS alpha-1,3-glucosyltransferase
MRIALVYPECHRRGGVERVVWEAARFLASRHDVTLVCRRGGAEGLPSSVSIVGVPVPRVPAPLAPAAFRWSAARALPAVRADVTVSFGFDCPAVDVLVLGSVHAAWLGHGQPVRWRGLVVPAGVRRVLPRHQTRLLLERLTLRSGGRGTIVAVSDNVADDVVRLYGVAREGIVVLPNGFDPEQCSPERRSELRPEARRHAGVDDSGPCVVMVANEWHRKGLGVLVDALGRLRDLSPSLALVGRMAPTQYEDRIRAAGLADRVHYLGPMDDVAEAYAVGDLFVLPTQYEAFGTVIVEALACGLPVVTTALAGASMTVQPGVNGLLQQDPNDGDELERLLREAMTGGALSRWSAAARESVAGYEWSTVMGRMESVIVAARADR